MTRFDLLDDRRGILDAFVVGRDDQRHQRQLLVFLVFAVGVETARNPSMRNSFVTEIRTDFHRVGRELDAVNAIFAGHDSILGGEYRTEQADFVNPPRIADHPARAEDVA